MVYQRKIYSTIQPFLLTPQALVITGMRRVGKTTLLKQLLATIKSENKRYLDLENLSDRQLFNQKNYNNIVLDLQRLGLNLKETMYLGLDEIQFLPEIASIIKYLYDHYPIKVLATGSSSYYLKNLFTESLAGRKFVFELFPLDFGEFLTFKQIQTKHYDPFTTPFSEHEQERLQSYYEEFIQYGGFPEIALTENVTIKKALLNDILSSYVNIDIKSMADFRKDKEIYNLIKMLATRIGSRIDYTKLASLCALSRSTVESYMGFFEKTYLISRINVYSHNRDREIVKAQKLYFCDNRIIDILEGNNNGSKFENAVYNQLRHYGKIQYYALKNGKEIDFILNQQLALEVKTSPTPQDQKQLHKMATAAGLSQNKLVIKTGSSVFTNYIWGGSIQ